MLPSLPPPQYLTELFVSTPRQQQQGHETGETGGTEEDNLKRKTSKRCLISETWPRSVMLAGQFDSESVFCIYV